FVLFEKGMDFEIKDIDVFNKPEDLALMNPYNIYDHTRLKFVAN
ncbi:hypothetical protein HMPREF9021_02585, partial [Simonsiella muelleri ATCC 29453]